MALGAATELLPYDGSAILYLDVLTPTEAGDAFESLSNELEWQQNQLRIYGRQVPEPRLVCWIGDPHARYSYSGIQLSPAPWSRTVTSLRRVCERVAGVGFNSVLVNLYRDGADSVAWHSDNEPELGIEPTIASLSLGATRRFDLRHNVSGETVKLDLPAGSVVVMAGRCQADWVHRIAKTKRVSEPRINLTFRTTS